MLEFFTNLTKKNTVDMVALQSINGDKTENITQSINGDMKKEKINKIQYVTGREFHNKLITLKGDKIRNYVKYCANGIFKAIDKYGDDPFYRENLNDILFHVKEYPIETIMYLVKCKAYVKDIEKYSEFIDINYKDRHGFTCLWYVNDVDYLVDLLSLKFNVNHLANDGDTFLCLYVRTTTITYNEWLKLLNVLNNYDFNMIITGFTLLDVACYYKLDVQIIILFMNKCNILTSSIWLYNIINYYDLKSMTFVILNIKDVSFLNKIMERYCLLYPTADNDMLLMMSILLHRHKNELINMIKYVDDNGNNLLHLASKGHLDKVIRFIMSDLELGLMVKNKDGYSPKDLYIMNDVLNLLHQDIKLF